MSGTHEPATPCLRSLAVRAENLAAEMAAAWRRGECHAAEHYLGLYPELLGQPEAAVRLVYEEACLRQERGEEVGVEELRRRFPRWADELALLLDCDRLVQQQQQLTPQFPAVGETLGEFLLVAELGRGGHGRVYLATQPSLADRPVVLKVTPRSDRESDSLARLQHTHVIPLHAVYDFPSRNLLALCQPHLGGTSLAKVLALLASVPAEKRTGASLVEALDRAAAPMGPRTCGGGPRQTLARLPYAEAVCWIGACLADALHYAHERGLLHLDVKPANVLLAADGQPLLLDFHLAVAPVAAGADVDGLGCTPGYASPEQQAAYDSVRQGRPVPAPVDGRSDAYSLGRLLYVALGGDGEGNNPVSDLRSSNPRVSPGLADVIRRCLAESPADRYPDAASLAADLRRHLAAEPLRGVPNRSLRERWRKWRRRRPHGLLWAALLLALAAGPAVLLGATLDRVRDGREALDEGKELVRRRSYPEASRTLSRGKARVAPVPGCGALAADLDAWRRRAQRAAAAERLHAVCERLRLLAGADVVARHDLLDLDAHCRAAWESRDLVADPEGVPLDAADEARAKEDLTDLALLWADLKRRLDPQGVPASPDEATSREPVVLGRELLRAGRLDRAAEQFERAIEARPQDFWAHFYRGACCHRLGRHAEAVHSFGVAIALAPGRPEAYHNRALAHAGMGDADATRRDYDRALALAPELAASRLNRGVLNYQQGRHEEALADLDRALRDGADPAACHYNLALARLALRDGAAARTHLEQALRHDPRHARARSLSERLRAGK